ncbi:MAG: hypothetical protein DMD26_18945 [Gemmatimonadetes bacterium]|nr:MAG: hypothetical protein DMD26_18945 [Gemmatimonadota bacterium]
MSEATHKRDHVGLVTDDAGSGEPAHAPQIRRRVAFTRKQLIGLPLLAAVPIMSVLGLFGERRSEVNAASRTVAMSIRYPARFRYRQVQPLDIVVRNISTTRSDTAAATVRTVVFP